MFAKQAPASLGRRGVLGRLDLKQVGDNHGVLLGALPQQGQKRVASGLLGLLERGVFAKRLAKRALHSSFRVAREVGVVSAGNAAHLHLDLALHLVTRKRDGSCDASKALLAKCAALVEDVLRGVANR